MKSATHGMPTSAAEVTNISPHGFWLLLGDDEKLLPFKDFPWFRGATVAQICRVELLNENHLYWPELDIDLAVESIDHPDRYPLKSRVGEWLA